MFLKINFRQQKESETPYFLDILKGNSQYIKSQQLDKHDSFIHSFSILSDDRSKASSKTMPPYSAIQSLVLQMRISFPVLKVIQ